VATAAAAGGGGGGGGSAGKKKGGGKAKGGDDASELESDASGGAGAGAGAGAGDAYHPVRDAPWPDAAPGRPVPYSALVSVFNSIEATTKRLEIQALLANFFRSIVALAPDDLLPTLYLCTNSIAPAYENVELGVGDAIIVKALAEATGRQAKDIKAEAADKGDLGLVAESR